MHDVYLGLGSNLGDRETLLHAGVALIAALPSTSVIEASPVYETPPMGPPDQDAYLNMAVHVSTGLDALSLLEFLQKIEQDLGRASAGKRQRWGPREIDIDILLFGKEIITSPTLTVPHTGMHERWFVLKPLSDIAADVVHPVSGDRIDDLLSALVAVQSEEVQA